MENNWSSTGFGKHVSPDMVEDRFLDVEIVILLQGTNMFGGRIYAYIQLVGRQLKEMFAKMKAGENFKPADFGTVLAEGRGEPTKEVLEQMAAKYNMISVPMPKTAPPPAVNQPNFEMEKWS